MTGKIGISGLGLLLMIICSSAVAGWQPFKQKPNIVFILADDLGWADLPVYGNRFNEAPNLDQLAREGMMFTDAYAAGAVCSPTRASIMSGQYPARVGIIAHIAGHWRPYEKVITPINRNQYLPEEIVTIGEALQEAGYTTGYFGKWHLGADRERHHPLNQGFDVAHVGGGYYNSGFDPPTLEYADLRLSDRLARLGIDFIKENRNGPFFLFLSHYDVHVQLDADMDLIGKYMDKEKVEGYPCNAVYAAMIEHLDRSVGMVTEVLKEMGLEDNTMIVFFSDNGGLVSRYDKDPLLARSKLELYGDDPLKYVASSNAPLRGEKGMLYEGGIRVPLIIKWPGRIHPGSVSHTIVSSVDFYPTMLELATAEPPEEQVLDGRSMLPVLLEGRLDPERAVYWHYPVFHHDVPKAAVRMGEWKLIEDLMNGGSVLYNLSADPGENTDFSTLYPGEKLELIKLLKAWQKEVGAEFPVANPEFDETRRYEWGVHPDRANGQKYF